MLEKARYIVVEGPIGAGKTTLAKRLAERINADVLLENPAANPFLGRFYQNMERSRKGLAAGFSSSTSALMR